MSETPYQPHERIWVDPLQMETEPRLGEWSAGKEADRDIAYVHESSHDRAVRQRDGCLEALKRICSGELPDLMAISDLAELAIAECEGAEDGAAPAEPSAESKDTPTPEPWTYTQDNPPYGPCHISGPGEFICTTSGRAVANARFIVEAPKNKRQRDRLLEIMEELTHLSGPASAPRCRKIARTAIAECLKEDSA